MRSERPKVAPCEDCGEPTPTPANRARPVLCIGCGCRRAMRAAQQMHAKKGPYYERWLEAMHAPDTGG